MRGFYPRTPGTHFRLLEEVGIACFAEGMMWCRPMVDRLGCIG
jgi:hypothetical protein